MSAFTTYLRHPINTLLIFIPIGLMLAHQQPIANPLLVFIVNGWGSCPWPS